MHKIGITVAFDVVHIHMVLQKFSSLNKWIVLW